MSLLVLQIILLLCITCVSCHELPTTTKVPDQQPVQPCPGTVSIPDQIRDISVKIYTHDTRFEEQNRRFEEMNSKFAKLNTVLEEMNTKFAQLDTVFAQLDTKFAVQNTKLAGQDIKILNQNIQIKNLQKKIEELEEVNGQLRNNSTCCAKLNTKFAVQDVKISDQSTKLDEQGTTILEQRTIITNLEKAIEKSRNNSTCCAKLNTKFAVQDVKISDQSTKIDEQGTTILEQRTIITNLEKAIEQSRNNSTSTGSIFTRWGRRDCPSNVSQLVYSGITGGSYYYHKGGAAEYVCLPPDPIWNGNKYYNGPNWGYMYGTEYGYIPQGLLDYNPPCAVCRTSQFSTVLMIPARSECYQGWQKAYHGELVSGRYDHTAASQYVCLDENPQTNGTKSNHEGKLMYPVRAKCGSLPCPPYEDNTLLTCVVCLK